MPHFTRVLPPILLFSLPASVFAAYTAVNLTPPPVYSNGEAVTVADGNQGGFATFGTGRSAADHALFWSGTAASFQDFTPTQTDQHAAATSADIFAITPTVQAGSAVFSTTQQAGYWTGSANSFTALPSAGVSAPEVLGAADTANGTVFVGDDLGTGQALLWKKVGSAYTVTNLQSDLPGAPGVYSSSVALATDGVTIAGQAVSGDGHAIVWNVITQASADLNGDFANSDARSVSGNLVAGYASVPAAAATHAILWDNTSGTYVPTDLNPDGASESEAYATNATMQAGYAIVDDSGNPHAYVWTHEADGSIVDTDLQETLDPAIFVGSQALGIDAAGNVVGVAFDTDGNVDPILWTISTPEPASMGVLGVGGLVMLRRRRG